MTTLPGATRCCFDRKDTAERHPRVGCAAAPGANEAAARSPWAMRYSLQSKPRPYESLASDDQSDRNAGGPQNSSAWLRKTRLWANYGKPIGPIGMVSEFCG